jgi:hypothetical protein
MGPTRSHLVPRPPTICAVIGNLCDPLYRFALLDKDGDGAITLADLPRTPVQVAADAEREREKDRKGPPRRR